MVKIGLGERLLAGGAERRLAVGEAGLHESGRGGRECRRARKGREPQRVSPAAALRR